MTNQGERESMASPSQGANVPVSSGHRDHEVAALRQELEALRAEVAALRASLLPNGSFDQKTSYTPSNTSSALTNINTASDASDASDERAANTDIRVTPTNATSRRSLLKWGGLGAAAAVAAGSATFMAQTAHAADGANLVLGDSTNTAEHVTALHYDGAETNPIALSVDNSTSVDSMAIQGTAGDSSASSSFGVLGLSGNGATSNGVSGQAGAQGNGVFGYASGSSAYGVVGGTDSGFGVIGGSVTGIDLAAGGTGRILQGTSGFVGAPTTGSYLLGESIRDDKGDLYICIKTGSPGTWRKVTAGIPGVTGSINFLANPIRLLDTRSSSVWLAGSTHTLQVTGVSIGGISVPSGAIGVIGNVTVVGPTGGGDLRLYPGATVPSTSSINFATNQIIANGVTVGLNGSGQFKIKVDMPGGTHTNVLFDASGFIL